MLSEYTGVDMHTTRSQIGTSLLNNVDADIWNSSRNLSDFAYFFHRTAQVNRTGS